MTKSQAARKKQLPKYILELSEEWECGCMETIIADYIDGNIEITTMYVRIVKFLMIEIDGQAEEAAGRN